MREASNKKQQDNNSNIRHSLMYTIQQPTSNENNINRLRHPIKQQSHNNTTTKHRLRHQIATAKQTKHRSNKQNNTTHKTQKHTQQHIQTTNNTHLLSKSLVSSSSGWSGCLESSKTLVWLFLFLLHVFVFCLNTLVV